MGWNQGYTIFEETVVGAYNLGKLDKALLTVLMKPYGNSDIDSGGSSELTSEDGKSVEQIVIETWGLKMPVEPDEDDENYGDYLDEVSELFHTITTHFGW